MEYLVTGDERMNSFKIRRPFHRQSASMQSTGPQGIRRSLSARMMRLSLLPVLDQKASAGYGAMMIDEQYSGQKIPVLRKTGLKL